MNFSGMPIKAKLVRSIALVWLSLFAYLVGVNAYAQDTALLSQDLTRWADVTAVQAISVNREFTVAGEIDPFTDALELIGLGVTGTVQLHGADSFVRVILVDDKLKEYLVYEAYPLLSPNQSFPISNACRETCVLPQVTPAALKIELIDAAITIGAVAVNPAEQLAISTTARLAKNLASVEEVKLAQETEIVALLNAQIKARGLRWVAGETSIAQLSYAEKKAMFGQDTLPNLQGFDYYIGGIFEVGNSGDLVSLPSGQSAFVESFDWRSRHGANRPDSPYYDGDEAGSGWITSVKRQDCADCWAHSGVGTVEAQVNIYFNQHLDLDLSEQQMVSCSGAGGCSGGNPGGALASIVNVGVVDEACFPSSGTDEPCANMCPVPAETIRITGYHSILRDTEDTLKGSIIEYGPIAFGISSWWHGLVAVGYQLDPLDEGTIWILKNSWGDGWGENGYGYIKVPLDDIYLTYAIDGPVTSVLRTREVACFDKDVDGYFNWGISPTKPASCPASAPAVNDCNDADSGVALQGDDGSCAAPEIQAALYDRGNGLIYDAVLDITWLQDGKFSRTRFIESDGTDGFRYGEATWEDAVAWTEGLVHLGYDDWRLPSLKDWSWPLSTDPRLAEMGHMFFINLSRRPGDSICDGGLVSDCQASFIDTGTGKVVSFFNMEPFLYWYAEEEAEYPDSAYVEDFNGGWGIGSANSDATLYFWPVRDGDIKRLATIEAESMALSGSYAVEGNAAASGGQLIRRRDSGGYPATASTEYKGPAGNYDIAVSYFDESDGISSLAFLLNDEMLDQWMADEDPTCSDCASPGASTLRTRVVARGIRLLPGDKIALQGTGEHYEYARFDKLTVSPVGSSTYEAEKMALKGGYAVEANAAASGGQLIRRLDSGGYAATASTEYTGAAGTYEITVSYFDESDGVSSLAFLVNGEILDQWLAEEDPVCSNCDSPGASTLRTRVVASELGLQPGDEITLQGTGEHYEYARFDKLTVVGPVIFDDGGVHTIDYTIAAEEVHVSNGTTLNIRAGASLRKLVVSETGDTLENVLNVYDGEIDSIVGGGYYSSFNIYGGSIGSIYTYDGTVDISGGNIDSLYTGSTGSDITISGGNIGSLYTEGGIMTISGGIIGDMETRGIGGSIEITGGTFTGDVSIDSLYAGFWVAISGGLFGGDLSLYGSPGSINLVFYGELELDLLDRWIESEYRAYATYSINGTLQDGSPLSVLIDCECYVNWDEEPCQQVSIQVEP